MNRRFVIACVVACSAVGLPAGNAHAQVEVDFLFGGGGYRHHHHYPYYRFYGDYYWYAPPPPVRYVPVAAPPQVVYVPTPVSAAPVVAAPTAAMQIPSLAPANASTSSATLPTVASPNLRTTTVPNTLPNGPTVRETSSSVRETVNVANPAGSGGVVSFILDGKQEVTLAPGESTTLKDAASYAVEFDRGESYGTTRLVLNEGTYEFEVTSTGWDLQRRSSVASTTNSLRPVVRRNTLPTQR